MIKYPIKVYKATTLNTIYLLFFITDYCNYNCWYCYNKTRNTQFINFNNVFLFIKHIRKLTNKHIDVNFIGGEPTLHSQLLQYLKKLIEIQNITYYVITNLSKHISFYNELSQYCTITASYHPSQISLDEFIYKCSMIQKIKDVIVMCDPNNFENAINAYNLLRINTNIKNIELDDVDNYTYSAEQQRIINKYKNNTKHYTVEYSDNTIDNVSFSDIANHKQFCFYFWKCNAGINLLYIHSNNLIYACESCFVNNNTIIGNINNINNIQKFKFLTKPIICHNAFCSGDFNILKTRVFKI